MGGEGGITYTLHTDGRLANRVSGTYVILGMDSLVAKELLTIPG